MKKHLKTIKKVVSMALVCALVFTTLMPATSYAKVSVATPKLTSVTATSNKATVKWSKVPNATGYQVYRAVGNNKFAKSMTIKGASKTTYINIKLKSSTKYRYKVRAYRVVSGKTYYGKFSKYRTVYTKAVNKVPTVGEKNALRKAKAYLQIMGFSKEGLAQQLIYEGFTRSQANYAVNHVNVSWKKQAVRKGREYLNIMGLSKQGLITQLMYEKFTRAEATYAANVLF